MKSLNFEEKIKLLEKTVNELENDNVNLDEAIDKYVNAMKLVKECDSELKNAEDKVAKIVNKDGSLSNFKEEIDESI